MQPRAHHPPVAKFWLYMAAALSLSAAIIHIGVADSYFRIWPGYGYFFVAAATGQLALAVFLWVYPSLWEDRPKPGLLLASLVGNVLILAMWLTTRTVGVPAGPNAGQVLPPGWLDVLAVLSEMGVIVAIVRLMVLYAQLQPTD